MSTINDLHKYSDRLNVLYVEDDENLRAETATLFKMFFKNLDTAEDGLRGLEAFNENFYDLVISDVNMPNMDGITLTKELRTLPAYKFTPILTLTTESSADKKAAGKQAGATGWIVKPFNPDQLLATVKKVLG